ncbi:MAG: hypothetical protein ACI86P_002386, partial [Flavobacteriales bacterium]
VKSLSSLHSSPINSANNGQFPEQDSPVQTQFTST